MTYAAGRDAGVVSGWPRSSGRNIARSIAVAAYRSGSITDPPEKLAELREWAVDVLSRFVKVFGPRVAVL
jgi:septum formation topological specificity factor MinE